MRLSEKEIGEYKQKLLSLRKQYTHSFEGTASDVKAPDESKGASQHHADEGTDDFGRTISIEVTSKGIDIIKQIDRALEKIEENTYGICDVSGDEIPKKRLDAIPYATMTVAAQQEFEKEYYG